MVCTNKSKLYYQLDYQLDFIIYINTCSVDSSVFSKSPHANDAFRNELYFKQFWGKMISYCLIWYLSTWQPFSKSILGFSNRYVGTHITHAFKPLLWHILMYIQRSWNSFHLWNIITNKSQTFRKSAKYNKIKSPYFVRKCIHFGCNIFWCTYFKIKVQVYTFSYLCIAQSVNQLYFGLYTKDQKCIFGLWWY